MFQIELSQYDMDMLREILEKHLSQLLLEIAFTHSKDSVAVLQKRKEFIEGFLRRLEEGMGPEKEMTGPEKLEGTELSV